MLIGDKCGCLKSEMRKSRVSEVKQELFGVPAPYGFESPTSWLSRAALSQGVRARDLLKHFGVEHVGDFDLGISERKASMIAETCGIPVSNFSFSLKMFSALKSIDREGKVFLIPFDGKSSKYRYCPGCLHHQRVKHIPVHWRFKCWRFCPIHQCLMEDRCLHCGLEINLPANMFYSGPKKEGIPFLSYCQGCEKKLSSHWKIVRGLTSPEIITNLESEQLNAGRAVLSAFYHGYYAMAATPTKKIKLRGLRGLSHLSGSDSFWAGIDNRELLRRRTAREGYSLDRGLRPH